MVYLHTATIPIIFLDLQGFLLKLNGHVHKMEDILETNNMHEHVLKGYTFEDIAYINNPRLKVLSYNTFN
jgi:hypothetical protein